MKALYWLTGLLLLETLFEALLCSGKLPVLPKLQKAVYATAGLILAGLGIVLSIFAWQVWLWALPFTGYRLVNLLRVYSNRLPRQQLHTMAVRAFSWLVVGQGATLLLAWLVSYFHLATTLLDVLVAAQLLNAIVLLRAGTHTWQHAGMTAADKHLSDKDLPTVSVLVPARNETDDLDHCLQTLVASDYPKLEILVLDDCSATRRTPEIIRSFAHAGVRFIQGAVPDETRWLAKNYAYEHLSQEASGQVLLFCGVDAVLAPSSIRRLVELLEDRGKDMLSVLPLRATSVKRGNSLLQAMRYYWEIALPRRFFKRPPVLSTCWLIRKSALKRMGGFESVSRSVSPEAPFARQAVVTDAYSFIRSDEALGIYSNKPITDQYATSVRVRYPQMHRRLELVALVSFFELTFLLGPLLGLILAAHLSHTMAYVAAWTVSLLCLLTTYGLVAVGGRLANPWFGWLLMPAAFVLDLAMLHISLWKYEFSTVDWKGRNVCIPVMQMTPPMGVGSYTPKA